MNTNKLKAYAPKARIAFMDAVKSRAAKLGIFEDRISEITIDGDSAIIEKEVYTRKQGQQRNQLVQRIKALGTHDGKFVHKDGFNQFINETAFIWFNRLTAIRYMEVNEYLDHGFRVLSKAEGAKFGEGFEILNSAADVADELGLNKDQIIDMVLDGNKEEELYRTLLLAQCHQLSEAMPFMFEKLDDATELLLPDNLTKTDSILKDLVNDIPEDNWKDSETGKGQIEVIGWLYQFYISEHKDAVIGKVVKREDIPAATQLFTPNWIVKYLVQNSLGRQWLATYPDSELKDKMEYYITPAEQSDDVIEQLKAITPTSIDPEEIKVLDPACGSGHILVEVYEVLREIYLERGYRLREVPELILTKNIYGLDIDDRAAQMAAFAVLMKAREDDKRIFTRDIKLNIHSVQSTENLDIDKLWADLDLDDNKQAGSMGDLFAEPQFDVSEVSTENKAYLELLRYLKEQFIDAKNLGSLIEVDNQHLESLATLQEKLAVKAQGNERTAKESAETLLPIVEQAIVLATKYDVAVANPPYMGSKGMNPNLKKHIKSHYPLSKADLYAAFIEKGLNLIKPVGSCSFITMQGWMFQTTLSGIRSHILVNNNISSLLHLGANAFPEISGEVVKSVAFVIGKTKVPNYLSNYVKLIKGNSEEKRNNFYDKSNHFTKEQDGFLKIPGIPISYWLSKSLTHFFTGDIKLAHFGDAKKGCDTGNNDLFVRYWFELDQRKISFPQEFNKNDLCKKWLPYSKGGAFRRWYGNLEYVVNWENDGAEIKSRSNSTIRNSQFFYKEGLMWSDVATGNYSARKMPQGCIIDAAGPAVFPNYKCSELMLLGYLNSQVFQQYLDVTMQGLHYSAGVISSAPCIDLSISEPQTENAISRLVDVHKKDWDSIETSWDYKKPSFVTDNVQHLLEETYNLIQRSSHEALEQVINDETLVNTYFIKSAKLENEIPANSLNNHSIREPNVGSATLELISYTLGCMMGRYSLDREGLVYAHSGNQGFKELVTEGAYNTFPADDDGIIPLAAEEWLFEDDATSRFREFVKTVWGEEHLSENLDFVAESLCLDAIKPKKGESSIDTIRRYFSTQFYKDHLKTYKKRPIYWLFSSGKAKAFECLVYLHRYNEGTLSRMRTEYVTPLMGKLESRKNILEDSKATASGAELRAIDKELKTIEKKQAELVTFDEELKHLAEMKISLDLDDGVKVNYGKFGNLLADVKAIHGKNPEVIK
ncbi:BREX-1 system adenine-specific DNA-methyltransferase PglX [Vibrio parahaemolyticus]|nr:BREX-1 system adenine-specific DNA-methyltransferase PglX [Vibrio parahaemolyticus]MDF5321200.1 BREX-1 system adenine-specific DNA-methyltransferase PglX [Vibrio parahaemolyticus]